MNFFQAQQQARKNTTRLIVLFSLAVLATSVAVYAAFVFCFIFLANKEAYFEQNLSFFDVMLSVPMHLQGSILLGTIGFILIMSFIQLSSLRRGGGKGVVATFGGRRVLSDSQLPAEKVLFNVVEEMCIAAGIPLIPVYVLDGETGINAFAAGFNLSDAVMVFSQGCLERLTRDELQGVVAHEVSHVLHGDMRMNIQISGWLYGILCISELGRFCLQTPMRRRSRSRDGRATLVFLVLGLVLFVVGIVGYFFGRLIQAAISRQREYLADASAVQYTRNPLGIAGALKKIRDFEEGSRIGHASAGAMSHFFIASPFWKTFLPAMLDTHPPLDQRIRLLAPSMELGTRVPSAKQAYEDWTQLSPKHGAAQHAKIALADEGLLWMDRLRGAQSLIDEIPAALHVRLVDVEKVLSVPFVLLMSEQVEFWRQHPERASLLTQMQSLGVQDNWEDLISMAESVVTHTYVWRLKLIEISAPALGDCSGMSAALALSEKLIRLDSNLSPFELMLFAVMRRFSDLGDAKRVAHAEIRKLSAVRGETEMLVSLCARARIPVDFKLPIFARNLKTLARLAPSQKEKLLKILHAKCRENGRLDDIEEAFLRALHVALDCPEGVLPRSA